MTVLVDGHNALGKLRLQAKTHEDQRRALLRLVAARAPGATVFFDARGAPDDLFGSAGADGVRVVYCRRREADDAILERVRDSDRPGDLLVVTNDREVAGRARQLGARTARVEEFFGIARRERAAEKQPPPGKQRRYTPQDFGLPDEVDLEDPDFE